MKFTLKLGFLFFILRCKRFVIVIVIVPSLQIGLRHPCLGPLPLVKPPWQPRGRPHQHVSQV